MPEMSSEGVAVAVDRPDLAQGYLEERCDRLSRELPRRGFSLSGRGGRRRTRWAASRTHGAATPSSPEVFAAPSLRVWQLIIPVRFR